MDNVSGLEKMLKGVQVASVICNQWGDTGKGKFSDLLASCWAGVIARGTGGNNAGHTTVVNGKKRIFHLVPAGIAYDREGKVNILGNGMVIDLQVLCGELDELENENMPYNNLMVSQDAQVILPFQIERDMSKNKSQAGGGIGSTGRGIGPCYSDKTARNGVFIRDLFNISVLSRKIAKLSEFYPEIKISMEEVIEGLKPYSERIKPFVRDTISEMHSFWRQGKNILIEGAQGLLLSIEFGTSPYVTSSDPSLNGTASGVGLSAKAVDLPLGIVKFPYMTRVGGGPFPSELGGKKSEDYCAAGLEHDIKFELKKYGIDFSEEKGSVKYDSSHPNISLLMNSHDPFDRGIGIRLAGGEYGATTGRPRRCGWTDLAALRYAVAINGPDIIITKPDVLKGAEFFSLANEYSFGSQKAGFSRDSDFLSLVDPVYSHFKGFNEDISDMKSYNELPAGLKAAISFAEKSTGARVRIVSVGAEPSQTIVR